jgi:hypothetical protein
MKLNLVEEIILEFLIDAHKKGQLGADVKTWKLISILIEPDEYVAKLEVFTNNNYHKTGSINICKSLIRKSQLNKLLE